MQPNADLKDVIKGIADAEVLVSDVSKGLSLKELNEIMAVAQDIPVIAADGGAALLAQYMGMDDAARADLDAYAASVLSFPADANVDGIVKKVILAGVAASAVAQALKG